MSNYRRPVNHLVTDIPPHDISFDAEAFDAAIRSQGVKLVHYRAMRCPVGMTDISDGQRPHPDHEGCSNGFIYTKVGTVTALFIGNSKHKQSHDLGFWDGSTVQVSFPRQYDESLEELAVAPFDRFYLDETSLTVPTWQLFLHHETGDDRLKYPVATVEELVDYRGERYYQDEDFTVCQGRIKWIGAHRPSQQLDVGPVPSGDRGAVCSIRYRYTPYWICGQVLHELRVSQIQNDISGERSLQRMPQSVMLHREYVALNKQQDTEEVRSPVDADVLRQVLGPSYGGFGPK